MKIEIKNTMANGQLVFANGSFVAKINDTEDGKEFGEWLMSINEKVVVDCLSCKHSLCSIENEPCNTCSENLNNYEVVD